MTLVLGFLLQLFLWVKNNWRVALEVIFAVVGLLLVAHFAANAIERQVESRTAVRVAKATSDLQSEVAQTHNRETGLIKKIETSDALIASLKKEIKNEPVVVFAKSRASARPSVAASAAGSTAVSNLECSSAVGDDRPVLSVGTVGVLDSARVNARLDTPSGGDAAFRTPSDIAVSDFVDNDLEVVRLYHRLATRHDALVEFVEQKMKESSAQGLKGK